MKSEMIFFVRILTSSPHDSISLWLVKWLLFRLMFASGVVKLTSGCPTWWGLTALDWHYESQVRLISFDSFEKVFVKLT